MSMKPDNALATKRAHLLADMLEREPALLVAVRLELSVAEQLHAACAGWCRLAELFSNPQAATVSFACMETRRDAQAKLPLYFTRAQVRVH